VRKLKLEIDELKVETFAIVPDSPESAGTVHGRLNQDWNTYVDCDGGGGGGYTEGTCIGPTYCCAPTWRPSCMPTCPETCDTCPVNWCTYLWCG